jgi:Fe-S oxidoreductase
VLHITEFLLDLLNQGSLVLEGGTQEGTYVYHDPCILSRKLEVVKTPRTLLASIPGVKLSETQFSGTETRCCGMGGLLSVTHPQLSFEMGKRRLCQLESTAPHIISACPACKISLTRGGACHVQDITEMIADSL